ncbi:MAG: POTRA domain-containing protein [Kofleriaceae bacterium]
MSRRVAAAMIALAVVLGVGAARAQDAEPPEPPPAPADVVPAVATDADAPPVVWTEWEVTGTFIDGAATVRALLAPEVAKRPALTAAARTQLAAACERIGYRLIDLTASRLPDDGIRATLVVKPILVVRWVDVDVSSRAVVLDDEIRRRMRLRPGTQLPDEADQAASTQFLDDEASRIAAYLRDEGYFEATVTVAWTPVGSYGVRASLVAKLGPAYRLGDVVIENTTQAGGVLAVDADEIRAALRHRQLCVRLAVPPTCPRRFTRAQLQADLEDITRRFQRRGYPAVRIASDFDPLTSFDRTTKTVELTLRIDERRRLDVVFEGNDLDVVPDEELANVLTFTSATTVDDVEVTASARAIERFYQSRGYFDVMVSYERVRFRTFDRVIYRIEPGRRRDVRAVSFVCRGPLGPQPCSLPTAELTDATSTRTTGGLLVLGAASPPTTGRLNADVAALERLYRQHGFLKAKARVELAPSEDGWSAAALSVAEQAIDRAASSLVVRFIIDEGARTSVTQINVVFEWAATGETTVADEAEVRARLGFTVGDAYVRDTIDAAAQKLQDWYWSVGRPRAQVTIPEPILSADGQAAIVTVNIEEGRELRIGDIIVRGNFRTADWVIRDELGWRRGQLLTGAMFRDGPARLRTSNLFTSVSIKLLGFDDDRQGTVDVLVRVEERADVFAEYDVDGGGSTEKGWFARARPSLPNLGGLGIRLDTNLTFGTQYKAAEATVRLPHWLARRAIRASFDTELAAYTRSQATARFGDVFTYGGTLSALRSWQREATDRVPARLLGVAVRYDVRLRSRDEELVRIAGAGGELTTNPIRTRTGTLGLNLTWDQRLDKSGNLNPLAPHHGFRAELGASYASPYLFSQDTFVKLTGLAQTFYTRGRLQLRLDARYDHGIPLGGAVLLPEVERFFAGGDVTVRGFEEDRLATEIVTTPVPPLGQTTQVRVLPAGGNIRALSTIDLQAELWKVGGLPVASALFVDAGLVTNTLGSVRLADIRPAVGSALRVVLPVGAVSLEYAMPVRPQLGDDPRGRFHLSVALRY